MTLLSGPTGVASSVRPLQSEQRAEQEINYNKHP
jgi:hypothetical protein